MHGGRMLCKLVSARGRFRRGSRTALLAHQDRAVARFLERVAARAPFYANLGRVPFADLPIVDKAVMMADFAGFNTLRIDGERALETALAAERSRDFRATIDGVTVGLSSGTSGNRGLFLASVRERRHYGAIVLARALSAAHLARVVNPFVEPLRLALFLRANSNLYATIGSARISFDYRDLELPFDEHLDALARRPPHVLVAPPSVLRALAQATLAGRTAIAPEHVVSVADVLEPVDAEIIRAAFGCPVHQIYQCTEGLLGYTCERGSLHLNETYVRIETEWIDSARTRFVPIVTDFSRDTQVIVRYRLGDVIRVAPPCACGRPERTVAAIDGRADEVIRLPARGSGVPVVPIFPDFVRRAMAFAGEPVRDYRVRYDGATLHVALDIEPAADRTNVRARVVDELERLWERSGARAPATRFVDYEPAPLAHKRRRVTNAGGA